MLESRGRNKLVLEECLEAKEGRGFLEEAILKILAMEEFDFLTEELGKKNRGNNFQIQICMTYHFNTNTEL